MSHELTSSWFTSVWMLMADLFWVHRKPIRRWKSCSNSWNKWRSRCNDCLRIRGWQWIHAASTYLCLHGQVRRSGDKRWITDDIWRCLVATSITRVWGLPAPQAPGVKCSRAFIHVFAGDHTYCCNPEEGDGTHDEHINQSHGMWFWFYEVSFTEPINTPLSKWTVETSRTAGTWVDQSQQSRMNKKRNHFGPQTVVTSKVSNELIESNHHPPGESIEISFHIGNSVIVCSCRRSFRSAIKTSDAGNWMVLRGWRIFS